MDQVYNILCKEINIDADRASYGELFNNVKKDILTGLKKDKLFKDLFCYDKLSGSVADKLKISKPNEFDLCLRIQFPANTLIKILPDEKMKGNIFIDLSGVLDHLLQNGKSKEMYNFLSTLVNDQNFLLENKFQQWFEGRIVKALNEMGHEYTHKNEKYKLTYKKGGPAHTIYVQNIKENEPIFSADFVPAFLFESGQSVSRRNVITEYWEAIPRPLKVSTRKDNPSFRTSYTDSERKFLTGKDQLKNALRLVKKFRDLRPNMQHLKSYYIKTLFLWIDEEVEPDFWRKPLFRIMRLVFKKLEEALEAKEIKFFWDTDLNMLGMTVKPTQIVEMHREVFRARKILEEPRRQKDILNLFVSPDEQTHITECDMKLISDSLKEELWDLAEENDST